MAKANKASSGTSPSNQPNSKAASKAYTNDSKAAANKLPESTLDLASACGSTRRNGFTNQFVSAITNVPGWAVMLMRSQFM